MVTIKSTRLGENYKEIEIYLEHSEEKINNTKEFLSVGWLNVICVLFEQSLGMQGLATIILTFQLSIFSTAPVSTAPSWQWKSLKMIRTSTNTSNQINSFLPHLWRRIQCWRSADWNCSNIYVDNLGISYS